MTGRIRLVHHQRFGIFGVSPHMPDIVAQVRDGGKGAGTLLAETSQRM
ncbi:MAG TPA: hypothetical protein VMZ50_08575 [Phycisphaerae bacterium]|nr:hypothetical protein [Phycisphaerae bacterium]